MLQAVQKVVIITGAASGIGLELVQYYFTKNYRVIGIDYNHAVLMRLKEKMPKVRWCKADISDKARMLELAREIRGEYGRVDIVIANAGVGGLNPATAFSLDIHEKTVNINCLGLAYSLVPFIEDVTRTQGSLVCISSMAAFRGLPRAASYSSTKSQQKVFMESLRVDLKPQGVHCLCVHPGFVKTHMTEHDDFDMPFMVSAEQAAKAIARAIELRKSTLLFPLPMKIVTFVNRLLPNWLYDYIVPKVSKMKHEPQAKIL